MSKPPVMTKNITARIPENIFEAIDELAKMSRVHKSQILRIALSTFLNKNLPGEEVQ